MTEDKEVNNKLYDLALEKNHGVPAPRGFGHHIDELNKKIADLEAKLAEGESKYKKAYQEGLLQKQFDKDMEIAELKQQLAEKEKELLEIKQRIVEKASKEFQEMIDKRENHNQDKISFAVECLKDMNRRIDERVGNRSYGIWELFEDKCNELKKELKRGNKKQ